MLYKIWYKKPRGIIWHKVKNVEADTIIETDKGSALPVRVFFLSDKTRLEIPMTCIIKFSKERFFDIQNTMESEAGQEIRIKSESKTKH